MTISTKEQLADSLLARLPSGADVWIDSDTVVVHYGCNTPYLYLPPLGGKRIVTPTTGMCYAIDSREQSLEFGMARLGTYTMAEHPDNTFNMGAHGEFSVSYAHVIGLEKLIRNRIPTRLTLKEIYRLMEPLLRQAFIDAITEINGSTQWEYTRLRNHIADLSYACWNRFFRIFFDHGLLLIGKQFRIEGISPPMLS